MMNLKISHPISVHFVAGFTEHLHNELDADLFRNGFSKKLPISIAFLFSGQKMGAQHRAFIGNAIYNAAQRRN